MHQPCQRFTQRFQGGMPYIDQPNRAKFALCCARPALTARAAIAPSTTTPKCGILLPMIVIISGTNRPGSNTRKVAARVEAAYNTHGVKPALLDLADLPPEIFSPTSYAAKPAAFSRFTAAVLAADGLVVVTPEYNGSLPGILKYFIDMLPFPESFERRPVCFVGLAAGMWGALRPVEQLQAIFGYRNALIFPERVFMPGIGKLLDESGRFTSPEMQQRLEKQAGGFISFVEALRAAKILPAASVSA
jgi:NAD(P)H-dependent FMN reductase